MKLKIKPLPLRNDDKLWEKYDRYARESMHRALQIPREMFCGGDALSPFVEELVTPGLITREQAD
jgi:hypothetical protein